MSEQSAQPKSSADATHTFRYKLGIFLFVAGNLAVVGGILAPLVGLASVLGAATIGAVIVGGEAVALTSIVFIGKAGFLALKGKIGASVKEGFTAPVGKTRHMVGITLFLLNVFALYLTVYYAWASLDAVAQEPALTEFWGMTVEEQWTMVLSIFLVGEIGFIVSLYVLGADWWERFRNLFVWQGTDA